MASRHLAVWRAPHRLTEFQSRVVAGLAIANLGIAATGIALYEGVPRIVHVGALALVGLTNLVWAIGSLLPEERGGRAARAAVAPLALLMIVALGASVLLLWRGLGLDAVIIGFFGAAGGLAAVRLTREQ
jgi:hypothetical protein